MKSIGDQSAGVNRFVAATLSNALKNMSGKNSPGNGARLRTAFSGDSAAAQKARPSLLELPAKKHELESINDAIFAHLQESSADTGAAWPAGLDVFDEKAWRAEKIVLGEGGFASVLPVEHPLVTTYISSYQQDNQMIYVSPQIARLGFAPEMWLGKRDLRLQQIHEGDLDRVTQALQHSLSTGEKFNCHYRLYDSKGKVRWFHDEASVYDESGSALLFKGVMLDITDKKEMEAELNERRYYLEQSVEQRTEDLMKRIALLESCNATLCNKLAMINQGVAAPDSQSAAPLSP